MTMTAGKDAKVVKRQHREPCHDCPWRRVALAGWLGPFTAERWIEIAHSEASADCHTRKFADRGQKSDDYGNRGPHCAGMAIYRANVCKAPRDPEAFRLNRNPSSVFNMPAEFIEHHTKANP